MFHLVKSANIKRTNLASTTTIVACLLLVLPSCRLLPKLDQADKSPPLPESFIVGDSTDNSAKVELHEFFNDPMLTGLIDEALTNNLQLKILAQDIQIANNEILARRGAYLPFVFLGSRAGAEKPSLFTPQGAVEEQLKVRGQSFPQPLPDFLAAATLSWEVDIWRRLRNLRDAAVLRYLGTIEGRNFVVTRLVADVAEKYYELLALDKRLETLDLTIELQEKSLEIAKAKKAAARGTELAVQRFQADVRKNQSEKLIISQEIVQVENRLNFLTGRFPQPVVRATVNYIDLNMHALSVGVPSQLLLNRPDIRQAENRLAAAGLDVRAARARFYPTILITGAVGYDAFNPRYVFLTPESLIYNLAGNIAVPLINRKAIKADYLTANAVQLQAIYEYQRVVLNAFTEVVNLVNKVENYRKSLELKKQQLASLEASVDFATKLFQNARADYVEVLLALRDLLQTRLDLIETKKQQLSAIVNTYQALGGGLLRDPSMQQGLPQLPIPEKGKDQVEVLDEKPTAPPEPPAEKK